MKQMILTYSRNGKSYETDSDKLSPQSAQYLLQYGWAQSLQDSIAGLEKRTEAEYRKLDPTVGNEELKRSIASTIDGALLKRSDGILNGSISVRGERSERDPLRSIANDLIKRALAKKSTTPAKIGKEKFERFVNELLEKDRAKVEAELKRRNESEVDVEI